MSLTGKYSKIERLVESVYRDNDYEYIDFPDILEWAGEAMDKIGVSYDYIEKEPVKIDIMHYRGEAPCDLIKIIQTREYYTRSPMVYTTDNFHRVTRSPYHTSNSVDLHIHSQNTYQFDGTYFYVNFEEGAIEVAYKAFPTDSRGYPLIPEDTKYFKAIVSYIQFKLDWKLLRKNKIQRHIYEESKKIWAFHAGQSKTKSIIPDTVDKWESLKNQMVRLMPSPTLHDANFRDASRRERRPNNPNTINRI